MGERIDKSSSMVLKSIKAPGILELVVQMGLREMELAKKILARRYSSIDPMMLKSIFWHDNSIKSIGWKFFPHTLGI